ncbi:hypothetical protein M2454_002170 [Aequitasia blattaphilus]
MKNKNIFLVIGILIFVISYMINRFVVKIIDPVYIVILLVSIFFVIVGMVSIRIS